jgi:Fe-S cluster assembly iron-binding protein IscA
MTLKFDSPTLAVWKNAGVLAVLVRFVNGGCAGTRISVEISPHDVSGLSSCDVGGIMAYFQEVDRERLDTARLTKVEKNGKEKWMYSDSAVKGRCGCGSSFSFTELDTKGATRHVAVDIAKIADLKTRLARKGN